MTDLTPAEQRTRWCEFEQKEVTTHQSTVRQPALNMVTVMDLCDSCNCCLFSNSVPDEQSGPVGGQANF